VDFQDRVSAEELRAGDGRGRDRCGEAWLTLLTPPGRKSFKPAPLHASSNTLSYLDSNIRTKMGVVRLRAAIKAIGIAGRQECGRLAQ
jgi:hypothetical protein